MKKRRILITLSVLSVLSIAAYCYATTAYCSDCRTQSCYGLKWSGNTPAGCYEKILGDDCDGNCMKCTATTSKTHCVHTGDEDDTCISAPGYTVSCGKTYKSACTGDHYPDCSCSGNWWYYDDSCSKHGC